MEFVKSGGGDIPGKKSDIEIFTIIDIIRISITSMEGGKVPHLTTVFQCLQQHAHVSIFIDNDAYDCGPYYIITIGTGKLHVGLNEVEFPWPIPCLCLLDHDDETYVSLPRCPVSLFHHNFMALRSQVIAIVSLSFLLLLLWVQSIL